jgi:two-component system, NtrC family, response regulator AtoC
MEMLLASIVDVAETNATVLISGESGSGKELTAKAIHAASPRRQHRFVKVNCAALPADLLESELFGHEKGSFTGAYRRTIGRFELADQGTIFLDEIGDMPLSLQGKLLHVLQDNEIVRVGGGESLSVDMRVIAATNRDLVHAVAQGGFRRDLYYRLKVVHLHVPPLRERRDEIECLAVLFLDRFNREFGRSMTLSPETMRLLREYDWPGNVRELENMIKRVVVLRNEGLLGEEIGAPAAARPRRDDVPLDSVREAPVTTAIGEVARLAAMRAQRDLLLDVLEQVRWNRAEAARRLNISYRAMLYKLERCGLARKRPGDPHVERTA